MSVEGMDWLNFVQLIAIPAFAGLAVYMNRIETKVTERLDKHVEKTSEEVDGVRDNVANWQLVVVRDYATRAELERLENRIVGAIERLESKLDKRFDAIAGRGDD